jgi:transcription antitermination factor NusG
MRSVVKFGERPAILPNGLVENLKAMSDADERVQTLMSQIAVGDDVRIEGGPFDQWIGEVINLTPPDRITLLIELASRRVPVTVSASNAMIVSADTPKPSNTPKSAP